MQPFLPELRRAAPLLGGPSFCRVRAALIKRGCTERGSAASGRVGHYRACTARGLALKSISDAYPGSAASGSAISAASAASQSAVPPAGTCAVAIDWGLPS